MNVFFHPRAPGKATARKDALRIVLRTLTVEELAHEEQEMSRRSQLYQSFADLVRKEIKRRKRATR